MPVFKYLLLGGAIAMFVAAAGIVAYDLHLAAQHRRSVLAGGTAVTGPNPIRWRTTVALGVLAWAPLLFALSILVVPGGKVGVH